jgi:zinc protease
VSGSPVDLEAGLQQGYALLTDGIIEEAAFKNWKLLSLQRLEQSEKIPQYRASEAMEDLLSGGDPRRLRLGKTQIESLTVAKGQEWFNRLRKESPIEVAVVGDISWEQAKPLIERYIGSLSKRPRSADYLNALRKSPRPPGPLERLVKVETVTPQGVVYAGFAASEGRNAPDSRALELASNILSSRLVKRIREELSIVYSIGAYSSPSWIYDDAGRFLSGAPCDPANSTKVLDEVHKAFKEFAEQGPTAEELANAKKQVANSLDTGMREPSYWWGILRNYDLKKRDLDVEKGVKEAFEKITKEQVREVFQKYNIPTRQFRISAIPLNAKSSAQEKP